MKPAVAPAIWRKRRRFSSVMARGTSSVRWGWGTRGPQVSECGRRAGVGRVTPDGTRREQRGPGDGCFPRGGWVVADVRSVHHSAFRRRPARPRSTGRRRRAGVCTRSAALYRTRTAHAPRSNDGRTVGLAGAVRRTHPPPHRGRPDRHRGRRRGRRAAADRRAGRRRTVRGRRLPPLPRHDRRAPGAGPAPDVRQGPGHADGGVLADRRPGQAAAGALRHARPRPGLRRRGDDPQLQRRQVGPHGVRPPRGAEPALPRHRLPVRGLARRRHPGQRHLHAPRRAAGSR